MDKYAKKKLQSIVQIICIVVLCLASIILDFVKIPYLKDGLRNGLLSKIIQQACGVAAAILIMVRLRIKLFGRPRKLLFLIPCLIIAIDNFQWASFFNGNMRLINTHPLDILLFIGYCMAVGLFEECIFRGVVFSLSRMQKPSDLPMVFHVFHSFQCMRHKTHVKSVVFQPVYSDFHFMPDKIFTYHSA